jgi:hypothetical protein
MDAETIHEVIKKLTGPIVPVGESNADDVRFCNLNVMCDVVDKLLTDINDVGYQNKDRGEYSMKRAGKFADDFFTKIGIIE